MTWHDLSTEDIPKWTETFVFSFGAQSLFSLCTFVFCCHFIVESSVKHFPQRILDFECVWCADFLVLFLNWFSNIMSFFFLFQSILQKAVLPKTHAIGWANVTIVRLNAKSLLFLIILSWDKIKNFTLKICTCLICNINM